jgi:hypothetical protein
MKALIRTVIQVRVVAAYTLDLTFHDGTHKTVDLEPELEGEIFEPLLDPAFFALASLDAELGTVVWPNGADFSPEFLYDATSNIRELA